LPFRVHLAKTSSVVSRLFGRVKEGFPGEEGHLHVDLDRLCPYRVNGLVCFPSLYLYQYSLVYYRNPSILHLSKHLKRKVTAGFNDSLSLLTRPHRQREAGVRAFLVLFYIPRTLTEPRPSFFTISLGVISK
jgi:hypothetical protein